MLLEQAGYITQCAYTATEALRLLEHPVDLLILDVMLPDIDGFTLCRRVRTMDSYVPIMMLTARDELDDRIFGLELGADEYIAKPFEPKELQARVRAMLRFAARSDQMRERSENPLMYGPITLWKEQHRVEVSGQPIELTPTEWELLTLLMEHPGRVFGRETILNRVWGADFLGDSRVVDVAVQRLRSKLEPIPSEPRWVQTVRGFGYRFVPEHQSMAAR